MQLHMMWRSVPESTLNGTHGRKLDVGTVFFSSVCGSLSGGGGVDTRVSGLYSLLYICDPGYIILRVRRCVCCCRAYDPCRDHMDESQQVTPEDTRAISVVGSHSIRHSEDSGCGLPFQVVRLHLLAVLCLVAIYVYPLTLVCIVLAYQKEGAK